MATGMKPGEMKTCQQLVGHMPATFDFLYFPHIQRIVLAIEGTTATQ